MIVRHLFPEHQTQRLFLRDFRQLDDELFVFECDIGAFCHAGGAHEDGQEEQ